VTDYIEKLGSKITSLGGNLDEDEDGAPMEDTPDAADTSDFPPLYQSGDDMEQAGEYKMQAADLKSEGKWEEALEKYTAAVLAAPPSSLLYANRAFCLYKLGKNAAAERDCDEALKMNPDSAKSFRVRGTVRKELENYEGALRDLSQAQAIDFDPDASEDLKVLTEKHVEHEKAVAQERIEKEEKMKKRAEEIKKAQEEQKEEAAKEAAEASRGMPGGMPGGMGGMPGGMPGMPGGMPGMPGGGGGGDGGMPAGMGGIMEMLMSDPELQQALQNPKVMAVFSELMSSPGGAMGLMSNPAKMQELMSDPEVGPVMQKIMAKFGGGMGGMPGGMGGMAGMGGGMPNMGGAGGDEDDDIPDLDDLPDLD
jgi:suppressor of tumorigenicity protein 13